MKQQAGFTLTEVAVAIAVAGLVCGGLLYGHRFATERAEWSNYSLAAQSLAIGAVEQARAARWDSQAWPPVDDLGVTNFSRVELLDLGVLSTQQVQATNYVSVSVLSEDPPVRQLRADCVWSFPAGSGTRGPFTNTVVTLRTIDG